MEEQHGEKTFDILIQRIESAGLKSITITEETVLRSWRQLDVLRNTDSINIHCTSAIHEFESLEAILNSLPEAGSKEKRLIEPRIRKGDKFPSLPNLRRFGYDSPSSIHRPG